MSSPLERLPTELIRHICGHLSPREKGRLALCSHDIYHKAIYTLYEPEAFSSSDDSVFAWACERGLIATIRILFDNGFDPNLPALSYTVARPMPLERAARLGNVAIVELLLKKGANPNCTTGLSAPLMEAMDELLSSSFDTVHCLLLHGADPNITLDRWQRTPLLAAVEKRDTDLIALLLGYGARMNPSEFQPLHRAICYHRCRDDLRTIQFLLDRGADPNMDAHDGHWRTPMARAVFECNNPNHEESPLGVLHMLMAAGANINWSPPDERNYPIHFALDPLIPHEVLEFLIHNGANANITNPALGYVWTPLHKAMGHLSPVRCTEILLANGALAIPAQTSRADPRSTPLGQLIANHLTDGRVTRTWKIGSDWRKARLLMEFGGPPVLDVVPRGVLATLFSLSLSACRNTRQMQRHIGSFATCTMMRIVDLWELATEESEFWTVWSDDPQGAGDENQDKLDRLHHAVEILEFLCEKRGIDLR